MIVLLTGHYRLLITGVFWLVIGAVLVAVAYPRSNEQERTGDDADTDLRQ